MNTIMIIVAVVIVALEAYSFAKCKSFGVKYNPYIVNFINLLRYRKNPSKYMQYAYRQIVDPEKYFNEIKKAIMKSPEISEDYADSIISITKEMMN